MGRHAQLVMGPAGSGKSTYVDAIRQHCENAHRTVHCVNLDPAAEVFKYPVSIDIRDLITVDEVMDELTYGPNGGLIYAMEYLLDNLEWFQENIGEYDDDYLIIDCPGQVELYTHMNLMHSFARALETWGYHVCAVYLIDSTFIVDSSKFISGVLMCLSAMIRLELPHVNVMTKMDLLGKKAEDSEEMEKYFDPDVTSLVTDLNKKTPKRFFKLNEAIANLIDDYSMVNFIPLNITDEESILYLLTHIDNAIQYGEDLEVREPKDEEEEEDEPINLDDY